MSEIQSAHTPREEDLSCTCEELFWLNILLETTTHFRLFADTRLASDPLANTTPVRLGRGPAAGREGGEADRRDTPTYPNAPH